MKKTMKQLIMALIIIGSFSHNVYAENEDEVITQEYEMCYEDELPDSKELFGKFVDRQFQINYYDEQISFFSVDNAYNYLDSYEKKIYDSVKTMVHQVAIGEMEEPKVQVSFVDNVIVGYGYEAETAKNEAGEKLAAYIDNALKAIMSDCPEEFYWFGRTWGFSYSASTSYNSSYTTSISGVTITFSVSDDYLKETVTNGDNIVAWIADTQKTSATLTALNNAKSIVEQNKDKSDYDKLLSYLQTIDGLVTYNTEAANQGLAQMGSNPWELIYVFDNDPATNVVCEGYSKAFQYLCDISNFSDDIWVSSVTGVFRSNSEGLHMWNIVHWNDANYLVDVTNSDGTTALFLKGYTNTAVGDVKNTVETGYVVTRDRIDLSETTYIPEIICQYIYDEDTLNVYSFAKEQVLALATVDYSQSMGEDVDPNMLPTTKCFVGEVDVLSLLNENDGTYMLYDGSSESYLKAELLQNGVVQLTFCNYYMESPYCVRNKRKATENLIYVKGDLRISVIGDCGLRRPENDNSLEYYQNFEIEVEDGTLSFSGSGKEESKFFVQLNNNYAIYAGLYGISDQKAVSGNVKLNNVSLEFSQPEEKKESSFSAIYAEKRIAVNNSKITIKNYYGKELGMTSNMLECNEGIFDGFEYDATIENLESSYGEMGVCLYGDTLSIVNSSFKIRCNCKYDSTYGGLGARYMKVYDNNDFDAEFKNNSGSSIYVENGTLSNSNFEISDGLSSSSGIGGGNITIDSCTITYKELEGVEDKALSVHGIELLKIVNSTININSQISGSEQIVIENSDITLNTDFCTSMISSLGSISITGGTTNITSKLSAIGACTISITGGTHVFDGYAGGMGLKDNKYTGKRASYTQNGGNVTIKSQNDEYDMAYASAIYASGAIVIENNGKLQIETNRYAVTGEDYELKVVDSEVTVVSSGDGITRAGKIDIENSLLTMTAEDSLLSAFQINMKDSDTTLRCDGTDETFLHYGIYTNKMIMDGGKLNVYMNQNNSVAIYSTADLRAQNTYDGTIRFMGDVEISAEAQMAAIVSIRYTALDEIREERPEGIVATDGIKLPLIYTEDKNMYIYEGMMNEEVFCYFDTFVDSKWDSVTFYNQDNIWGASQKVEIPFEGASSDGNIIQNMNLSLWEDYNIGFNFYLDIPAGYEDLFYVEIITKDGTETGTVRQLATPYSNSQEGINSNFYKVSKSFAAAQMTDSITVRILYNDIEREKVTQSIMSYAQKVLKLAEEDAYYQEYVDDVITLLNYGAAAQEYFEYETDNLANSILDSSEKMIQEIPENGFNQNYQKCIQSEDSGINYYGTSLILDSGVSVRHYFMLDENQSMYNYRFTLGNEELIPVHKTGQLYYITINNIPRWDLKNGKDVQVVDSMSGQEWIHMDYAVVDYIWDAQKVNTYETFTNLMKAMYWYSNIGDVK